MNLLKTIKDLKRSLAKRKSVDVNVNHLEDAIDTMSDEELDDYLDSKMIGDNDILDPDITKDSSGGGKILKFPSNITKH